MPEPGFDGLALGIEAASDDASVALLDGERVVAAVRWRITSTASRELLAAIDTLLRESGVARAAIASVAVDVGPGGYGSLRTSVATAQGLAVALDVPLAGVDRLEVAACPHLSPDRAVVAVHDLGRSGVAWTAFAPHAGTFTRAPEPLGPTRIDAIEECVRRAPVGAVWCGDLGEALRAAIAGVGGIAAGLAGADTAAQSGDTGARAALAAVDVVRLARARHAYGDAAAVDVTYLRPPSIGARRALG
jgi:tRNA threonylcarbamoyladenosine biosynthesis protein TsaB